jgi:hypothetical protein
VSLPFKAVQAAEKEMFKKASLPSNPYEQTMGDAAGCIAESKYATVFKQGNNVVICAHLYFSSFVFNHNSSLPTCARYCY